MGQSSSRNVEPRSPERSSTRRRPLSLRPPSTFTERWSARSEAAPYPSPLSHLRSPSPHTSSGRSSTGIRSQLRRRARFSRNRLSGLFSHDVDIPEHPDASSNPSLAAEQPRETPIPQIQTPDLDSTLETPPISTTSSTPPPPETPRLRAQRSPHGIADRISSLTPDRGFRSMTASLRRRRSPLRSSEDPSVALTRLLSLAAQATAASLLGRNAESAMADLRSPSGGIEGDDGTFNGFLQALQNGRFAAALNQEERSSDDEDGEDDGRPATFEFFRMFRFGSSNNSERRRPHMPSSSRPSSSQSSYADGPQSTTAEDGSTSGDGEHRMVPILIVGVRALGEADEPLNGDEGNVPSFFDALTNGPNAVNFGASDTTTTTEDILPSRRESSRHPHRRRASMGNFNLFSHSRESTRQSRPSRSRPGAELHPFPQLETPPGPFPPPTTPSSPGVSAGSSETSTPARRSSFSTSGALNTSSRRNSLIRRMGNTPLEPTAEESPQPPRLSRRRRSSEPDAPHFGSGSSRRNGMLVEPRDSPAEGHRSWIIYILGGSYPENHPILTTPSLFTDSPTYEDMVLLSSLLGQAKPPVANEEDVASAGGLFKIKIVGSTTIAIDENGDETLTIPASQQCLVCLSDYQEGEEARRLKQCQHFFHRECIDQWLTTGRNSCPLCRGQGVDEKKSENVENEPV